MIEQGPRLENTLNLVGKIQTKLVELEGKASVLVGGYALDLHGLDRTTRDVDLCICTADLFMKVLGAIRWLEKEGYECETRTPEPGDPLGGVVNVRGEDIYLIQIINFYSSQEVLPRVADHALEEGGAPLVDRHSDIRVCSLEHLVAMKLCARGKRDLEDVEAILEVREDFDIDKLQRIMAVHPRGTRLFEEFFSLQGDDSEE